MKFNFFVFLLLSLLVFTISKTTFVAGVGGVFADVINPLKTGIFGIFNRSENMGQTQKLEQDLRTLQKQLVDQHALTLDLKALKDQFQTSYPNSQNLLPAHIVGAPAFIPGVTSPSQFIINRGKQNEVQVGFAVVFKDNLIGKVVEVSENLSRIDLVTNTSSSLTAKNSRNNALGVIKGKGNGEMVLDNVLLSEELRVSDLVVTKGDLNIKGVGLPEGLIVGKITSVDKNPSALFQTANVKSLLDVARLTMVYIVMRSEQ